jgi:signal transduction histidine kinase
MVWGRMFDGETALECIAYGVPVTQVGFRSRLFAILLFFALVPSILLSLAWGATSWWAFPLVGAPAAWDSVAATGKRATQAVQNAPLTKDQQRALQHHDSVLAEGLLRSKQVRFVSRRVAWAFAIGVLASLGVLALTASKVAGHLSRNLSRPLQELVGWTERIGRGQRLPEGLPRKGAPEFEVLRRRMREMSAELELGRARALEAERAAALRESARQVAHELKNPLTPIRFAVDRLRRDAPTELAETVEVLAVESQRLENMARSFSQFGRLPEGPQAEIDLGELVRYTARATVPSELPLQVNVADDVPMIHGHYDALSRALSNIIINAVEACRTGGSVGVQVQRVMRRNRSAVAIEVSDTGCGIAPEQLHRIWEPYVTHKPGGTGLGLAIARQTVLAHDGEVEAESAPGEGTRVRFILPVNGTAAGIPIVARGEQA